MSNVTNTQQNILLATTAAAAAEHRSSREEKAPTLDNRYNSLHLFVSRELYMFVACSKSSGVAFVAG